MKLLNDVIFKDALSTKSGSIFLMTLINMIVGSNIKSITLLNPTVNNKNKHIKSKTMDMYASSENYRIMIEANNKMDKSIVIRNTVYLMSTYCNQFRHSEEYDDKVKFIQINLSKYNKSKNKIDYYQMSNQDNEILRINNMIIYEYNISKCKKEWYNLSDEEKRKNKLLNYLAMFDANMNEIEYIAGEDEVLKEVKDMIMKMNDDPDYVEAITPEEDYERELNLMKKKAEQKGMRKGKLKGIREGKLEGKLEGELLGKIEGIEEGKRINKLQNAKALVKAGVDIDVICNALNIDKKLVM